MKHKRIIAAVAAMATVQGLLSVNAFAAENDSFSGYVLMNIPYSQFYAADSAEVSDVDAVSSATNKTGNYSKAGGAFHSGKTAEVDENGTVSVVGKDNGSKVQGVTWAVKADSLEAVKALGGTEITDSSKVTTATAGKGKVSSNELKGYQALTEAPAYSYYVLDKAPANYVELDGTSFKKGTGSSGAKSIDISASYGTNWGDIQLNLGEAEDAGDKIVNAIVLTTSDGTSRGLYHLDQIWSFNDVAWKVASTSGLDGKKITGVRYYCSVKDSDLTDDSAPAYENYVYDYTVDLDVPQVYTGEVSGKFRNEKALELSGLPADVKDLKAKVYYTTGGRNASYTYITPVEVDPRDDDIDPVFVDVANGRITVVKGSVTNKAGTTESYGEPVDGTDYTVELSAGNYIIKKFTVHYNAAENVEDSSEVPESSSTADGSSSSQTASSSSSSSSGSSSSSSSKSSQASNANNNPATGSAATAVVGIAVLGCAAAVVSKKRKN
ncbi:MAG: NPXTG-anchored protein [Ruminococcus sp.]|nr:NPXTG-anchored protein [Ruminococcus sp.]